MGCPFYYGALGLFVLSAEVERYNGGGNHHNVVGGDVASNCQCSEHADHCESNDGFNLNKISEIFQKVVHFNASLILLSMYNLVSAAYFTTM